MSCLFCRIASGEIPADIVWQDDALIAFRDIAPQAPTHILLITRDHHVTVGELATADPALAATFMSAVAAVAAQEGLSDYRLVFNSGAEAGQSVFHVHGHLLAGRPLSWPPG
jgi:histidine triad (HIT) family protein